jgi:hypothetical protein
MAQGQSKWLPINTRGLMMFKIPLSNASTKYGASYRYNIYPSENPSDPNTPYDVNFDGFLHLQKIKLNSGAYDSGGAYWGFPNNVYCAANKDLTVMIFVRGDTRNKAKIQVRAKLPGARFYV